MKRLTAAGAAFLVWVLASLVGQASINGAWAQTAGQVCVFTDATHCPGAAASGLTVGIANAIADLTGSVLVSGATAPTGGQVLTATDATHATWQTVSGTGTVTSVNITVPSYLTASGGPITGAGVIAISLSGTALPLTAGGTGLTTLTANAIYKGNGSSPLALSSIVDNGSGVVIGGATGGAQGAGTINMAGCYINGTICSSAGGGVTTAVTPDLVISGVTIGTTIPANSQSGNSYAILTGDNTKTIIMAGAGTGSPPVTTMTIPVAGSTGFAAGWGTNVIPTAAPTTITAASGTLCEQPSMVLGIGQLLSIGTGSGTDYVCGLALPTSGAQNLVIATPNGSTGQPKLRALVAADIPAISLSSGVTGTLPNASVAATPATTGSGSVSVSAPRAYYVCTSTCSVTLPTPAAGYEFCVRNDNNVTTVITFAGISGVQFENTNFTSYKSAAASIVSGGAAGDKLCVLGRDATHYMVMSYNGTWS